MALGRNEELVNKCYSEGNEDECPFICSDCPWWIRKQGDNALKAGQPDEAIRQYKRAVFASTKNVDAWYAMAGAYAIKAEYNNAILAYNKALAADPLYGDAMLGKAKALRELGKTDSALEVIHEILELYDDPEVRKLQAEIQDAGVQNTKSESKAEENSRDEKEGDSFKESIIFKFGDYPSWTENGWYGHAIYILADGSVFLEHKFVLRGETDRFLYKKIPEIVPRIRKFLEDHANEIEQIPSNLGDGSLDDNGIDIILGDKKFFLWSNELHCVYMLTNMDLSEEAAQLFESIKRLSSVLTDFFREVLDSFDIPMKLEVDLERGIDWEFDKGLFWDEGTSPFA